MRDDRHADAAVHVAAPRREAADFVLVKSTRRADCAATRVRPAGRR